MRKRDPITPPKKSGKWVENTKGGATNARFTQERDAWAAKNKRK